MAKDINIHIKTQGVRDTQEKLRGVGKSAEKVGESTEKMGAKGSRGAAWLKKGIGSLVGPLGFAAIAMAVATAAVKVAKFFDDLKTQADESVRKIQQIRTAFEGLFEARGAFSEKQRAAVTKETTALLKETSATADIGLLVIEAYTRNFQSFVEAGKLTQEEYARGLQEMLGYAERHGGRATADLVAIMRGWGAVSPERQGEIRRMIATGAQVSGLTDEDVISALGRGLPTVKAMGWTPQQAIETIAILAAGEVGRKRMALPGTTLQALMAPQVSGIEEYLIAEAKTRGKLGDEAEAQVKARAEELGRQPRQLLAYLAQRRQDLDQRAFTRMLIDIYGTEAAAGVSKLLVSPRREIREELIRAAGIEGLEAEREEEEQSRLTQRRRDAKAKAAAQEEALDRTTIEQYEEDIREIGAEKLVKMRLRKPIRTKLRQIITLKEREKEIAAEQKWVETLTEEDITAIREGMGWPPRLPAEMWRIMTPQERFEALTGGERIPQHLLKRGKKLMPAIGPPPEPLETEIPEPIGAEFQSVLGLPHSQRPVSVNHYYDNSIKYYPRVGDDMRGARFPSS